MNRVRIYGTDNSEPCVAPLPSVLMNKLRGTEPKAGTVIDGTNLRVEREKARTACGLGKRVKIEGERFLRTDREQPRRVKNTWHRYNG